MRFVPTTLASLLLAGTVSAGNVLVVDWQGPGFTHIQHAVDAAQNGDTIIVRNGTYPEFWLVNRELAVVAAPGHTVIIDGSVEVRFLASDRDVLLSGLTIVGEQGVQAWSGVGLRLKNNVGAVRVQDCVVLGTSTYLIAGARSGVTVENCTNVAFTRCTITGSDGTHWSWGGGHGLESSGSAVSLDDCLITGGVGGSSYNAWNCMDCSPAGGGVVTDSFLFGSGSRFEGGEGGTTDTMGCCFTTGCVGGTGLTVQTPGGDVVLLASTLLGGLGGYGDCCGISCELDGPNGGTISGLAQILPGIARGMILPAVVRDPSAVPVTVEGLPGEMVSVRVSRNTEFDYHPSLQGVQLTDLGALIELGTIPPSGALTTTLDFQTHQARGPRGAIRLGEVQVTRSTIYHVQVLRHPSSSPDQLGSARSIVVLD